MHERDASDVTRVAIDETAARRGHASITLFVDIEQARVLFATEGKECRLPTPSARMAVTQARWRTSAST
jgi:hypothetical protein